MTTSMKIVVPVEIPLERLQDLMILCIEHAGYGSFNWHDHSKGHESCGDIIHYLPLTEDGAIYFKDKYEEEDEEGSSEEFILDRAAVERGLTLMAQKYPHHFQNFVTEADDVIIGDVFLQCALLGEVVYG